MGEKKEYFMIMVIFFFEFHYFLIDPYKAKSHYLLAVSNGEYRFKISSLPKHPQLHPTQKIRSQGEKNS